MIETAPLLAFVAAATILTVTPGLDTALVLRSASVGSRQAKLAALGISFGCLVWGAAASIGLGALFAASPLAFAVLKWSGAAYLLWLGVRLIASPRAALDVGASGSGRKDRQALRSGFLTNMLNPKVGVFYITFLPQFIPAGVEVVSYSLLLAVIHVLLGLLWFAALIAATVPLGRMLQRPATVKVMDRMTGGVFIAFGMKLALSKA